MCACVQMCEASVSQGWGLPLMKQAQQNSGSDLMLYVISETWECGPELVIMADTC